MTEKGMRSLFSAQSQTSVGITPGHCAWHGYHGMTACPKCSTGIPQPLSQEPESPAVTVQTTWRCPGCGFKIEGEHGPNTLCPFGLVPAIAAGWITVEQAVERLDTSREQG